MEWRRVQHKRVMWVVGWTSTTRTDGDTSGNGFFRFDLRRLCYLTSSCWTLDIDIESK